MIPFKFIVTDDQIWKNFVLNEEMTSKMQPSTVIFVVNTEMADTSLVSRVRTTAGTRQNNG